MANAFDPERFKAAAARFRAFFGELTRTFVEREDVLKQIALALLCREHVLMTGPPGTAKSQIASAVLGRIVDERTGQASLFARQFTESTVQTDLIGPINFKTLVETGHTEHFTDEGMLGAVHAFLDEVLDGRDMLLRSVLNVLQERELKQGSRVTKGQIECAVMTTNRYLAEVLEGSRDTLLAFVDRIAFVNFVPKGFADPSNLALVLRRQIGTAARPRFEATLTIQDLDTLQAAADSVFVSDSICGGLALFLEALDGEMQAAARADPSFVATRYLSTRTAVRTARVLRAICVLDRIVRDESRQLEVTRDDFPSLRLQLILAGPTPEASVQLLSRESDPRERRQLGIVRTEREIFERCLSRLPPIESTRQRPSIDLDIHAVVAAATKAIATDDAKAMFQATTALATAADSGAPGAEKAQKVLDDTLRALVARAVQVGLTAGAVDEVRNTVNNLALLAESLEQTASSTRPTARWLRGRALSLVEEAASLLPATSAKHLDRVAAGAPAEEIGQVIKAQLAQVEQFATARARLRATGADVPDENASAAAWARVVARAEGEIAALWDVVFLGHVAVALESSEADGLAAVFDKLSWAFETLDELSARIDALGGAPSNLKTRVVRPRLSPLVAAVFERMKVVDRISIIEKVERMMADLDRAKLRAAIAPADLLAWSAAALVRTELSTPPQEFKADGANPYGVYRALRAAELRVPLAYTIVEIALRVVPDIARGDGPESATRALIALTSALPDSLRASVGELELSRIERAVRHLEAWWSRLAERGEDEFEAIARSGFFTITRDEAALSRFALEARLLGEVLPEHEPAARALRTRIDALESSSTTRVEELLRARADRAWSDLLRRAR